MKGYRVFGLLTALLTFLCLLGAGSLSATERDKESDQTERTGERVARLEQEILKLQDGISLLMENLSHCAEENEVLAEKLQRLERGTPAKVNDEKRKLLQRLGKVLRTEKDLGFLLKLTEDDLERLMDILTIPR